MGDSNYKKSPRLIQKFNYKEVSIWLDVCLEN